VTVAIECQAEWMRPPDVVRDTAILWRAIARTGEGWRVEGSDRVLAAEADLLSEVESLAAPFSGGRATKIWLVADNARAIATLVTERDLDVPLWLACSLKLTIRTESTVGEEHQSVELLRQVSAEVDSAWACVGGPDVVVGGMGTLVGLPRVGWANQVAAEEYDLGGLADEFRGVDAVTLEQSADGALVYVDGVRWDIDNHRARRALDVIASVWERRFHIARSVQERQSRLEPEA
jgi:hypothetical protein